MRIINKPSYYDQERESEDDKEDEVISQNP
jgi:hypothetical protein